MPVLFRIQLNFVAALTSMTTNHILQSSRNSIQYCSTPPVKIMELNCVPKPLEKEEEQSPGAELKRKQEDEEEHLSKKPVGPAGGVTAGGGG